MLPIFKKTILVGALFIMSTLSVALADEKQIFGRAEFVKLPQNLILSARMDTGANTASINAFNIKKIKQGEDTWVQFETMDPQTKKIYHFKLPYLRTIRIKARTEEDDDDRNALIANERYVVAMPVCLGHELKTIDVNLTDRSHFRYPFLFGRKAMLKFNAIIDPALNYTQNPHCE